MMLFKICFVLCHQTFLFYFCDFKLGGVQYCNHDLSKSSVVFCRHLLCGFNYNLEEVDIKAHTSKN